MITKHIKVTLSTNQESMPVAMVVQTANQYQSVIHMESGCIRANAKSIMGMMAFGLHNGLEVDVTTDGIDEAEAMTAVERQLCCAV